MTRILLTDSARDAIYTKVNQIADEKQEALVTGDGIDIDPSTNTISVDPDINVSLGTSDTMVPSQNAVKTYVDNGLSSKADDSAVMHNAGVEIVRGNKIFVDPFTMNSVVRSVASDFLKGSTPSGTITWQFLFNDSSGSWQTTVATLGRISQSVSTSGDVYMDLISNRNRGGEWTSANQTGVRIYIGTNNVDKGVRPISNRDVSLGNASALWKDIYANSSIINTSDERLKQNIEEIPDEVLEAWGEVNFYQYKFKDSVEKKGSDKARKHTGVIAQRIDAIFKKHRLNAADYGLFCYDEWEADPEIEQAAGNQYSIRYEECLCMEAAYQRYRAEKLEERISRLEGILEQH